MHVVVVNLQEQVGRSNRTGIHVKSNKGERASVLLAVRTDEFTLAETHIGLERQRRGGARPGICSRPATADVSQSHEPVEVRNLRWIVDIGQRLGGIERIMVDEDPERRKPLDTSRNRVRTSACGAFAVAIRIVGVSQLWTE